MTGIIITAQAVGIVVLAITVILQGRAVSTLLKMIPQYRESVEAGAARIVSPYKKKSDGDSSIVSPYKKNKDGDWK